MKSRKGLIALVIVVAVLVLGIGYAIVSNTTLTISGTAAMKETQLDIGFNGVVTTDITHATGATATGSNTGTTTAGVKTATITVSDLAEVGDYAEVTYTIQNYEDDVDADVYVSNIANSKSTYFEVTTDATGTAAKKTVAKNNGTNTVKVTVKLIKRPTAAADNSTDITITLTGVPVE